MSSNPTLACVIDEITKGASNMEAPAGYLSMLLETAQATMYQPSLTFITDCEAVLQAAESKVAYLQHIFGVLQSHVDDAMVGAPQERTEEQIALIQAAALSITLIFARDYKAGVLSEAGRCAVCGRLLALEDDLENLTQFMEAHDSDN